MKKVIARNREYDEVIRHPYVVLGILIVLTFVIAFGRYLFGADYFIFKDAGSDCFDEYYPLYVYVVDKIKAGEFSLWNNSWGLGCDTLSRQEWVLDPFAVIIIVIGVLGDETTIACALVWVQLLKIVLAGLLFYRYLACFGLPNEVKVITAYLFGFSSYLMVWGQHYWFGAAEIYMIVLLVVAELWLQHQEQFKKYMLLYSLVVAVYFIYSVYFAYMAIIVTSIYICLRYLYICRGEKSIAGELLKNGIRLVFSTILGMVIAGCMVLPFVDNTLGVSTRISTQSLGSQLIEWLVPYDWDYILATLLRMISSNVMGINSLGGGYYGLPLLSVSVVGVPFLTEGIIAIAHRCYQNKREKGIFWISVALFAFLLLIPLGSSILNAFQYPFGRYTFVILPVIAVVMSFGIRKVFAEQKMNCLITGMAVVLETGLLIYAAFAYENTWLIRNYIKLVILLNVLTYVFMFLYVKKGKRIWQKVVFALMVLGCIGETYVTSASSERIVENDLGLAKVERTKNIIEQLEGNDSCYFRIDKTYNDYGFLGDMLLEGLHLSTCYNSTLNGNSSRFYEEIWPEVMTNGTCKVTTARDYIMNGQNLDEDNVLSLVGVKYILSDCELENTGEHWKRMDIDADDVIVYRNMQAHSIVTAYDQVISEQEFEKFSNEERKQLIKSYLVVPPQTADVEKTVKAENVDLAALENTEYDNAYELELIKDTYFKGELTLDHDKYLLIAIPYRSGWNIYVDGQKAESYQGDYGFWACKVAQGEHVLEVRFENRVYPAGMILSLFGIAIWIVLYKSRIWDVTHQRQEQ